MTLIFFFSSLNLWNMYEYIFRTLHFRRIQNYTSEQRQRMEFRRSWQKFLEPFLESSSFKEEWFVYRNEEGWDCATRSLRFAEDTFYHLAKITLSFPMKHECFQKTQLNQMTVFPSFLCNWLSNCYTLHSINTKILKGIFLYDIDSTLEVELES